MTQPTSSEEIKRNLIYLKALHTLDKANQRNRLLLREEQQKLWLEADKVIPITEHEKLMNDHPMKKQRDELLEQLSKIATDCINNHIPKERVEELRNMIYLKFEHRHFNNDKTLCEACNVVDLIRKILLGEK